MDFEYLFAGDTPNPDAVAVEDLLTNLGGRVATVSGKILAATKSAVKEILFEEDKFDFDYIVNTPYTPGPAGLPTSEQQRQLVLGRRPDLMGLWKETVGNGVVGEEEFWSKWHSFNHPLKTVRRKPTVTVAVNVQEETQELREEDWE